METSRDTTLDALAAQVRAYPPLTVEEIGSLLREAHDQPRGAAQESLVEHHLAVALDAALARHDSPVELVDLYQEGSIAVVTAVEEYAARSGPPDGLRRFVARVVDLHLDAALERDAAMRASDQALVRDSELYETAEVALRHRLGRAATSLELAAALGWPLEKVDLVGAMLADARSLWDAEIADYLDELSDAGGAG